MPPEMVNNASSRMMKGRYSPNSTCTPSPRLACQPKERTKGTRNSRVQPAVILPKW
ncbi:hypothetical protein D3C76_1838790 [compost metagenome]